MLWFFHLFLFFRLPQTICLGTHNAYNDVKSSLKIVKQFINSKHNSLFFNKFLKFIIGIIFLYCGWIIENLNLNALNLSFNNVTIAGRFKCCGMEDWTVGLMAAGRKKLICGLEGGKCCGVWPPAFSRSSWATLWFLEDSLWYC